MSEEWLDFKLKVKVTLEQVMKVQMAGRGIALLFLKHEITWVGWRRLHPNSFTPCKEIRYLFYKRGKWAVGPVWTSA
jgi:hypothetical protein